MWPRTYKVHIRGAHHNVKSVLRGHYQNPTRIGVAGWRGRGRRTKMRSRAAGDRVRG